MFKRIAIFLFVFGVIALFRAETTYSWGFFGHKRINRMAVFTLPPDMVGFYKDHIEFVTEHAVDPDKRRYSADGEAPRHYIDIDHFVHGDENTFEVVPRKWDDAVEKFTEDTLQAYGIVPWHVDKMVKRLTYAFKDQNLDRILRTSSDLGHYVGDMHVPLHTTENYNGQFTNQKGIHGFWESRLPELKAEEYEFWVGRATYVDYPLDLIWKKVEESHLALDSVLGFEAELTKSFPTDKKYSYENRGAMLVQTYSEEFSTAYHARLNGMVERRMRSSVQTLGSFWYTAWVNAGQPDLSLLDGKQVSEDLKKQQAEEERLFGGGKIKGREHNR